MAEPQNGGDISALDGFKPDAPQEPKAPAKGAMGPPRGRGAMRGNRGRDRGRGSRNNGPHRHSSSSESEMSFSSRGSSTGPRDQRAYEDRKLSLISGSTADLPVLKTTDNKISDNYRLYVGGLPNDFNKDELEDLFKQFGTVVEIFSNAEKLFAFVRMDSRVGAEKALCALNGSMFGGRTIRVRVAPSNSAIKCKNLNQFVTNELLFYAFQVFGEVEHAVVIANTHGKSTGEGIVEFARKAHAQNAIRRCTEESFFLTDSPQPVIVEPYEKFDDVEGFSEKSMFKRGDDYYAERRRGPRFPPPGSIEAEYGERWKNLLDLHKKKKEALEDELKLEIEKMEAQMKFVKYDSETEHLRAQLRQREEAKERQKTEWELVQRSIDERRRAHEDMVQRQNSEITNRMHRQDEELRRRQEEHFRMQQEQNRQNNMAEDSGEGTLFGRREPRSGGMNGPPQMQGQPIPLMGAFDMGHPSRRGHQTGRGHNPRRGFGNRNENSNPDIFGNKRRRF